MQKEKEIIKLILVSLLLLISSSEATLSFTSDDSTLSLTPEDDNSTDNKDWIILPFVFSFESTGVAGGIGAIKQGLFQPQTTLVASLFGGIPEEVVSKFGEEESSFKGSFLYFYDYRLPFTDRTFFSIMALRSYFPNTQYHLDGSNDSDKDDVFKTSGDSEFVHTEFKYILPIGEGVDNPLGLYSLRSGFCTDREGCGGGDPFITGRTSIGIRTFYQSDTFDNTSPPDNASWDTNGLRFFLKHDNTDFDLNPSLGYSFDLQFSKDFGLGASLQSWDFLELKYNHYVDLDTFSFTQQNVLAMSMWTGYSFSWDNTKEISPGLNAHRPPTWEGARLGGFFKMRAYDNNRFTDKAAFYATAEYRAILNYNPLKDNDFIPIEVDWFQLVAFVEAGRVHDVYNFDLVSDMKYDVGLSLRVLAAQLPLRFDVAYGEEGSNIWVMVNQPFDF